MFILFLFETFVFVHKRWEGVCTFGAVRCSLAQFLPLGAWEIFNHEFSLTAESPLSGRVECKGEALKGIDAMFGWICSG